MAPEADLFYDLPQMLRPGQVDDNAILSSIGELPPWDETRFEVLDMLQSCPRNSGGVYLVKDHSTERHFAVKRMPLDWTQKDAISFKEAHPAETEVPWMDMAVTRWLSLCGYENCVEYQGVFRDGDYVSFVMGFAEGGDLFSFLEAAVEPGEWPNPATEDNIRALAVELLGAVARLHGLGLAHRDLSLENILLQEKKAGPLCIIDFGMATTARFHEGPACGKASYIAPEIHTGGGYDAFKADSFSCGVVLYALAAKDYPWMCTRPGGCKCFEFVKRHGFMEFLAKRNITVGDEKKPVAEVISPSFAQLLAGLLQVSPKDRLVLHSNGETAGSSVWEQPWLQSR